MFSWQLFCSFNHTDIFHTTKVFEVRVYQLPFSLTCHTCIRFVNGLLMPADKLTNYEFLFIFLLALEHNFRLYFIRHCWFLFNNLPITFNITSPHLNIFRLNLFVVRVWSKVCISMSIKKQKISNFQVFCLVSLYLSKLLAIILHKYQFFEKRLFTAFFIICLTSYVKSLLMSSLKLLCVKITKFENYKREWIQNFIDIAQNFSIWKFEKRRFITICLFHVMNDFIKSDS